MKNKLLALGLIVLVLVAFSGSPAKAQTTSAGPYYATPSWDQKLQCDTKASCPRFVVLSNWNNEAVLDRETGLVWERWPIPDTSTWDFAQVRCNFLSRGGRLGWRLPTLQELASLADTSSDKISLPNGHPFAYIQLSWFYWSATTSAGDPTSAWVVSFGGDGVSGAVKHHFGPPYVSAWCVRGGQGVDPQ